MKILIVSPVPRQSSLGNAATARRWEQVFLELGHEVEMLEHWSGESCDLLLALHARRSHDSIEAFSKACPKKPLIVALTGTDLYQDLPDDEDARDSLRRADRLVLLQEHGRGHLPEGERRKAVAILQSARPPARVPRRNEDAFDVCVLAHLREVKDPFLAARAARLLPEESRIRIVHAGRALEEGQRERARQEMEENPRYHWLGELEPEAAKERLAASRVLALTSRMEGGANVVSEAVVCEVPVLSTRISGSLGMLGEDYPGFFPVGDAEALAGLLLRAEREADYVPTLLDAVQELRPRLRPEVEREAWRRLLEGLIRGGEERPLDRLRIERPSILGVEDDYATALWDGLSQEPRRIPCRFLYDERGAQLFEEITRLEAYYPTRAEQEILDRRAAEIVALCPEGLNLVELGSGSSRKTEVLIEALLRKQGELLFAPLDVSEEMLELSARALLDRHPGLSVSAFAGEYEGALRWVAEQIPTPRLYLWLGSSIGNFDREQAAEFLRRLREGMAPGDSLLLGVDLRKDKRVLERAYDDPDGVTRAFIENLLVRANRECGTDFDMAAWRMRSRFEETRGHIEIHLESLVDQTVGFPDHGPMHFGQGERLHVEDSYKYSRSELEGLARAADLRMLELWTDEAGRFASCLLRH